MIRLIKIILFVYMVLSSNKKLHQTNIAAFVLCMSRSSILHKTLSAIFAGELGVIARGKTLVLAAGFGFLKGQRECFRFKIFRAIGASLIEVRQSGCFLVSTSVVKVILF